MLMNVVDILTNEELNDIPILHIIRVINCMQEELIKDEQSSYIREKLYKIDKSNKE